MAGTMSDSQTQHLVETSARALQSLADLIEHCTDPGGEALGAQYELRQALWLLERPEGVAPVPMATEYATTVITDALRDEGYTEGYGDELDSVAGHLSEIVALLVDTLYREGVLATPVVGMRRYTAKDLVEGIQEAVKLDRVKRTAVLEDEQLQGDLREVLEYVSRGRGGLGTSNPYPDFAARRALALLQDLLPSWGKP